MTHKRLYPAALGLILVLGWTVQASWAADTPPPRDGQIVDEQTVQLGEAQLKEIESRVPAIRAQLAQLTIKRITYLSDGLKVKGYLVMPAHVEGKLPCVIFNRGGNRDFGALNDMMAVFRLGSIAARGYIVVASQYRGTAGGEGHEEFGGADVNDVLHLLPLLESLPQADPTRIGMYGWSRGGLMTYLALARTDRIRAAVIGGGLTDLASSIAERPDMETEVYSQLVPRWSTERQAAIDARSPVRWAAKLNKTTPLLLLHGGADWRVSPRQALRMADALLEARQPFRLVLFEGGDHGIFEHAAERDRLALDWLDTYVRDGKTWPSLEPHGD
jgi:dipeptidyl aminopeptidase/acylaminoacyl peptidase